MKPPDCGFHFKELMYNQTGWTKLTISFAKQALTTISSCEASDSGPLNCRDVSNHYDEGIIEHHNQPVFAMIISQSWIKSPFLHHSFRIPLVTLVGGP